MSDDERKVLGTADVAKILGMDRRKTWRYLKTLDKKVGGTLLRNVSRRGRPRWTVTVAALRNASPEWFGAKDIPEDRLQAVEARLERIERLLSSVVAHLGHPQLGRLYQSEARASYDDALPVPSELEEEINSASEAVDGLSATEGGRRFADALASINRRYRDDELGAQLWNGSGIPAGSHAIEAQHQRAQKAGVESTLSIDEWESVLRIQNGACAYCGDRAMLTIDHIVPISRGGANIRENVVAACWPCNSSKRDSELVSWLERMEKDVDLILQKVAFIRDQSSVRSECHGTDMR